MGGGVDVELACKLALAYLSLENSAAVSKFLGKMHVKVLTMLKADGYLAMRYNENGALRPEYMANFGRSGRNWTARWHKKVAADKKRTATMIDCDVDETLPRQWAMLQPAERRNDAGKLIARADASLTWPDHSITPGEQGIRVLVVTLLCWGSCIVADAEYEAAEWTRTAADVASVLNIMATRQGPESGASTGGRAKCVNYYFPDF